MKVEIITAKSDRRTPCRIIMNVPIELRYEIKRRALDRNQTLSRWLMRAIITAIKEEKKYE